MVIVLVWGSCVCWDRMCAVPMRVLGACLCGDLPCEKNCMCVVIMCLLGLCLCRDRCVRKPFVCSDQVHADIVCLQGPSMCMQGLFVWGTVCMLGLHL